MTTQMPFVSVIVPCRNERAFIGDCLDSILRSDYHADRFEIIVSDGMSDDGTREILRDYVEDEPRITIVDNPRRITPTALNAAIDASRGEIVIRMDAHNVYPRHYISSLVEWLLKSGADNVGGAWETRPGADTAMANAIAVALGHPFAVGNAHYRLGVHEPTWVDTVPFGCYRRDVFSRFGTFDEELVRNQDDELNLRIIKGGGCILLVPNVVSIYHARPTLRKLGAMYHQYGYFKPLVIRKVGSVMTMRQTVPAAFVASLVVGAGLAPWIPLARTGLGLIVALYLGVAFSAVVREVSRVGWGVALRLPAVFATAHFSYGTGFLRGVVVHILRRGGPRGAPDSVPITR